MNEKNFQICHDYITTLMKRLHRPAKGCIHHPYAATTDGNFYAALFLWDEHHMTLRYAADSDLSLMKNFLANYCSFQHDSGYIPTIVTAESANICDARFHAQPYLAQNAAIYLKKSNDKEFVKSIYPNLVKYLDYYRQNFRTFIGLYRWGETYMSGFDNEIAGTLFQLDTMISPDINSLLYLEFRAMAAIGEALQITNNYAGQAEEIAGLVNQYLYDPKMEMYGAYDLTRGRVRLSWGDEIDDHNPAPEVGKYAFFSCPALLVLYAGIAPESVAKNIIEKYILSPDHYRSEFGIRSLSKSSEYYNNARWGNPPRFGDHRRLTNSNWQGPVWVPINWFVFHALLKYKYPEEAAKLCDDNLKLIADSISNYGFMRENFNAETGEPLYADNFASWNILTDIMPDFLPGKTPPLQLFF